MLHPRRLSLTEPPPPSFSLPNTIYSVDNKKKQKKQKQQEVQNKEYKTTERGGKNKAITLQLGRAQRKQNCSFNDEVLDDESDEDGDDGEDHEEEERALLVRQAASGPAGLGAGPGARAGGAAAHSHLVALRGQRHRGAVGAAQLGGVMALPHGTHPETVVAAGLQVLHVEGRGRAFVGLRTTGGGKEGKIIKFVLFYREIT